MGDPLRQRRSAERAAHEYSGVGRRQKLAVPTVQKAEVLAAGARGDIYGVKAAELLKGFDLRAEPEISVHAGKLQDEILVEFGKAGMLPEAASPAVPLFEDGHGVFFLGQSQGAGEAGGTRPHDGDFLRFRRDKEIFGFAVLRVFDAGGFDIAEGDRLVSDLRPLAPLSARGRAQCADERGKNHGVPQLLVGRRPPSLARLI
jgi:hypothetical protein